MSQELLYTSAPRGLKPGSRGFCTVLSTQGMAAPLATALEGLSGYRPIYPTGDERASRNPVVASHLKLQAAGRSWSVLSRIADYGLDYSQRANKLAHHVVIDKSEQPASGPASLLVTRGYMRDEWSGEPKVVALKPGAREVRAPSGPCRAWQESAGDAGWAGALAESFLRDPERLVILLFAPGQDILPLFNEALSLLPPERRWDVTFSTYFTGLATSTTCVWRAMVHDSKEAHESLRFVNALRLDLTSGSLGPATGGDLVAAARSGTRPHAPPARPNKPFGPSEEEFVELEPAHDKFASTDDPSAEVRFAGVPQTPPPLATSRGPQTATDAVTKPTTRRRLADVVAEESNRPRSRRWVWLTLTTVMLLIAASIGLCFVPEVQMQIRKFSSREKQQQQALNVKNSPAPAPAPAQADAKPEEEKRLAEAHAEKKAKEDAEKVKAAAMAAEEQKRLAQAHAEMKAKEDAGKVKAAAMAAEEQKRLAQAQAEMKVKEDAAAIRKAAEELATKPVLVKVPTNEAKVELYKFSDASKKVDLRLLKPSWLPYESAKPSPAQVTANAKLALVVPATAGPETVALFTQLSPSPSDVRIAMKSLNDEHIRWLGWYHIRVVSPVPNEALLKVLAFSDFPLKIAASSRTLKKVSPTRWPLPTTATVDSTRMPQLILDRLTVLIGGRDYPLSLTNRDPRSTWTVGCNGVESSTYTAFGQKADDKPRLSVEITVVTSKNSDGAFELKLLGKEKFLSPIKEELKQKLFEQKNRLLDICGKIDVELKQHVDDQFRGVDVVSPSAGGGSPKINPALLDRLKSLIEEAMKEKNMDRRAELKMIEGELSMLDTVFKKIEEFRKIAESLDSVEIVSARIYYELFRTVKKKGDNDKFETVAEKVTEVDVVNFDDTKPSDSKNEEPNP